MDYNSFRVARINKDKNFDGKFFFGVSTTKIFCRPSCPSPIAKEENVKYFSNIYEPLNEGYRPCLRCRPDMKVEELSQNMDGQIVVKKAIKMISEGFLNTNRVVELAEKLHVSDRHLRKLFVNELGTTPVQIAKYHRCIFAKKLLIESNMAITEIAYASGFGSIRQFNHTFKNLFNMTPSMLRKEKNKNAKTAMYIPYRKDFDFKSVIDFLKPRRIKGVEVITQESYSRTFSIGESEGYFTVTDNKEKKSLEIRIFSDNMSCYMTIYYKVRRMFDLDRNITGIKEVLDKDHMFKNQKIPALTVAFDTYEFIIRAILGQQITVKAATTLAGRIVEAANLKYETPIEGLTHIFPDVNILSKLELGKIGVTKTRINTINNVNRAILTGELSLVTNQSYEEFSEKFIKIKGIGDWTLNYVAMRGLGMVDAFPAGDLGVIKALTIDDEKITSKDIINKAQKWRPYRAYATLCLWERLKEI